MNNNLNICGCDKLEKEVKNQYNQKFIINIDDDKCIENCTTCNKLTNQKTCKYLAKGSFNYAFNFTININTYIFKIQNEEKFTIEDLQKFINKKIFNQHVLLNSIYCIKSTKLNYFNDDIIDLKIIIIIKLLQYKKI